jgi:hypothetical protein
VTAPSRHLAGVGFPDKWRFAVNRRQAAPTTESTRSVVQISTPSRSPKTENRAWCGVSRVSEKPSEQLTPSASSY